MADDLGRLAGFLYETGLLKRYKRSGWSIVGVKIRVHRRALPPHSGVIGAVASLEEADPQRTAMLCLFHDTQETRLTDLPHIAKRYVTTVSNGDVTTDQTRDLPAAIVGLLQGVVTEYEDESSLEAVCAHDADKLECLIQACEYREHGYRNTQGDRDVPSRLANAEREAARARGDEHVIPRMAPPVPEWAVTP